MPNTNRKSSTVDLLMQVYLAENAFQDRLTKLREVVRNMRAKFANDPVPEQFRWAVFPQNSFGYSYDNLMPGAIVPVSGFISRSSLTEKTRLTDQTRIRLGKEHITIKQLRMSSREIAKEYRNAVRANRLQQLRESQQKRNKEIEETKKQIAKLQSSLKSLEKEQETLDELNNH